MKTLSWRQWTERAVKLILTPKCWTNEASWLETPPPSPRNYTTGPCSGGRPGTFTQKQRCVVCVVCMVYCVEEVEHSSCLGSSSEFLMHSFMSLLINVHIVNAWLFQCVSTTYLQSLLVPPSGDHSPQLEDVTLRHTSRRLVKKRYSLMRAFSDPLDEVSFKSILILFLLIWLFLLYDSLPDHTNLVGKERTNQSIKVQFWYISARIFTVCLYSRYTANNQYPQFRIMYCTQSHSLPAHTHSTWNLLVAMGTYTRVRPSPHHLPIHASPPPTLRWVPVATLPRPMVSHPPDQALPYPLRIHHTALPSLYLHPPVLHPARECLCQWVCHLSSTPHRMEALPISSPIYESDLPMLKFGDKRFNLYRMAHRIQTGITILTGIGSPIIPSVSEWWTKYWDLRKWNWNVRLPHRFKNSISQVK